MMAEAERRATYSTVARWPSWVVTASADGSETPRIPSDDSAWSGAGLAPCHSWRPVTMTNMIIYFVGTLFVVLGLAYAATRLGVSNVWIIAGALVIIGIGLMGGIVK